jgi:PhnB protein
MKTPTSFAPELTISKGVTDISFYTKAFGAILEWCLKNDDGSVHVAQFNIDGGIFHVHEQMPGSGKFVPAANQGVTAVIGLFVDDVEAVFNKAIKAGAKVVSPVTDHDYGWRQGELEDVFGHRWQIQKIYDPEKAAKFLGS